MNKSEKKEFYFEYLSKEGFKPSLDDDGDINFKHEGRWLYLMFGDEHEHFLQIVAPYVFDVDEKNETDALKACSAINMQYMVTKAFVAKESVFMTIEMFLNNAEDLKGIFYDCLGSLNYAIKDLLEKVEKS